MFRKFKTNYFKILLIRSEYDYKRVNFSSLHFSGYSVISLPRSVIYFGGRDVDYTVTDWVAEFKNLEWNFIGNLARPRHRHSSIKVASKIYTFGGEFLRPG